jgi:hypothetical protein
MTNRKKKRRRRPSAASGGGNGTRGAGQRRAAVARESGAVEPTLRESRKGSSREAALEGARAAAGDRPRMGFGARLREPSPFPPFTESIVRGFVGAAGTPVAFVSAFLGAFTIWGVYVALGLADLMGVRSLATLMTVPPLYLLFTDRFIAFFPLVGDSGLAGLSIAVGLTILRVLLFGAVAAFVAARLGWDERPPARAFVRALPHLLLVAFALFVVAALIPYLVGGFVPGTLGGIVLLGGPLLGLHFLVFAPISAVLDGVGYRDAVRRSARAARLPGGSHLGLTFGYFAFTLFLVSLVPARAVEPATPSVAVWAISLGATFVHVAAMSAFVYRWLAVRDEAGIQAPSPPPARAARS